ARRWNLLSDASSNAAIRSLERISVTATPGYSCRPPARRGGPHPRCSGADYAPQASVNRLGNEREVNPRWQQTNSPGETSAGGLSRSPLAGDQDSPDRSRLSPARGVTGQAASFSQPSTCWACVLGGKIG